MKQRNIRVNAISPDPIDTPIFSTAIETEEQIEMIKTSLVDSVPMGRMGLPDEIAKAVLFLPPDDSSYVTCIDLFVDGEMAQIQVSNPQTFDLPVDRHQVWGVP